MTLSEDLTMTATQTAWIAFDGAGIDCDYDAWQDIAQDVGRDLAMIGFDFRAGSLVESRWSEFDEGCRFDGTPEECAAIKTVLVKHQVTIYEGED